MLRVNGSKLGEQELHDRLLAAGVKLSSGRLFFARPPRHPCFRVSIACSTPEQIDMVLAGDAVKAYPLEEMATQAPKLSMFRMRTRQDDWVPAAVPA